MYLENARHMHYLCMHVFFLLKGLLPLNQHRQHVTEELHPWGFMLLKGPDLHLIILGKPLADTYN